jgi:hypothetical protein
MSDDITENYHGGNPYSHAAHDSIEHRKELDFTRILKVLHDNPHGLTCEEVEIELEMKHQTCSARFTDMKKLGWIIWCGERVTSSGRSAGVWRMAPLGDLQ